MKTAPYSAPERQDEWVDEEASPALPARPRRRLPALAMGLLFALLVGAIGFYVGIRVEKGQLPSGSTNAAAGSRLAAALGTRGSGGTGAAAGAGFARAFGGGGAGANSSVGTISAVNGKTLFLTDLAGNTLKVKLSGATTITKSLGVSAKSVHPGDTVVVSGLKGQGTIAATSINDTGARGGASTASPSSGSTSASSAVSSLFGSGGGG